MKCRVLPFLLISFAPVLRAEVLPVLNAPMANLTEPASRGPRTIALNSVFGTELIDNQVVRFTSQYNSGGIPIVMDFAMFSNRTPVTRTNFLNYVTSGAYTNTFFHRSVDGFVVQGGGFRLGASNYEAVPQNAPIVNEFGVSNTLGTVSMAKLGGDPNSATNQFFVSTGANSEILDPQNGGFTVFARVTKDTMANVMIFNDPGYFPVWRIVDAQNNDIFGNPVPSTPLFVNFTAGATQDWRDFLINFPTVALATLPAGQAGTSTTLTYTVQQNTNAGLVTPTIVSGNQLQLAYAPAQVGTATITIRATDSVGNTVDDTFSITVQPSYTTWKNGKFSSPELANPAVSGALADPEADGTSNLELFFHGLERGSLAKRPVEFLGFQGGSARKPRFRFPIANAMAGVTYQLQRSSNLAENSWTTIPHSIIASTNNGTSTLTTIEATQAQPNDAKAFYRIAYTLAD
jgi:cyclophilin family peptidyl-prolyl cis-trans isomerase